MFSIIAAIGKNRELGKNGDLVFHIKEDMAFFKKTTMGHKVLMGHLTWDSLPKKLPGRENIVVSRGKIEGADETVHDLAAFVKKYQDSPEEIFVIGGAMVYNELIGVAKNLYLTEVEAEAEADTYFPDFKKGNYDMTVLGEGEDAKYKYRFVKYTKKGVPMV